MKAQKHAMMLKMEFGATNATVSQASLAFVVIQVSNCTFHFNYKRVLIVLPLLDMKYVTTVVIKMLLMMMVMVMMMI